MFVEGVVGEGIGWGKTVVVTELAESWKGGIWGEWGCFEGYLGRCFPWHGLFSNSRGGGGLHCFWEILVKGAGNEEQQSDFIKK